MADQAQIDRAAATLLRQIEAGGGTVLTQLAYADAARTKAIGGVIAFLERDAERLTTFMREIDEAARRANAVDAPPDVEREQAEARRAEAEVQDLRDNGGICDRQSTDS